MRVLSFGKDSGKTRDSSGLSTGAGRPLKSVTKDMRWSVGASVTAEQRRDHEVYDL